MNEETKNTYSLLQDIFKNVWEQQKYSEIKNGVLLTLNLAMFALISRVYFSATSSITSTPIVKILFFILIVFFVLHILWIIKSFFPKDSNKEDFKRTDDEINIFFFGDIGKLPSSIYLELLLEKTQVEKANISKEFLLDLANQIVKLSEITQSKYTSFKASVTRMYWLGSFAFIYFTYLYFV